MMRKLLVLLFLLSLSLPFAAIAKKKEKGNDEPQTVKVLLKDGSRVEGKLTTDWFRWPAKSINENFKVGQPDGSEREIRSEEVDTIWCSNEKTPWTSVLTPVGKMFKVKNCCWIVKCGPKSANAEILTYVAWANISYGTRSQWEPHNTYCVRFGNDSIAYPFYYPIQNGDFNVKLMKKALKESRPGTAEYIEQYFKKHKDQRKQLREHPELLLEAYEQFLKENK